MSSEMWGKTYARSPRQDRRVIEDGKFVELGKVQHPEPPVEEKLETALEIVHVGIPETTDARTSAGLDVQPDGQASEIGIPPADPEQPKEETPKQEEAAIATVPNAEPSTPEVELGFDAGDYFDATDAADRADAEAPYQDESNSTK
jgi:hypothetical protein